VRISRLLVFLVLLLAVLANVAWARFVLTGGGRANVLTILSVGCDQTNFTALQPNATVCNIQVTMSAGSFIGSYAISGTDAGTNFLLMGSAVTQIAGTGTAAGTYTHLTITVTQASATNSPQSFSPTLVGSAPSGVFDNGNAPWPFYNKVPAINYDLGGQGHGYNVPSPSPFCTSGSGPYRSDEVNFKPSTFDGTIAYQLGCSSSPTSYSYQINISAGGGGPYTCTLQTADTSSGGSWQISIDGAKVATVPTSNTGSFTSFGATTSGVFNATLGNHTMTLAWASGDTAYGGSGDLLTWQCQAAGSSSAPAQAVAAGFSTLAADFDFSTATYAVTSNWLDCSGTNASYTWHLETQYGTPCNAFFQTTDPLDGSTVLDMQWLPSFGTATTLDADSVLPALFTVPSQVLDFGHFYVEYQARLDVDPYQGMLAGPYLWGTNYITNPNAYGTLELDLGEMDNFNNGGGGNATPGGAGANWGYHQVGNFNGESYDGMWICHTLGNCNQGGGGIPGTLALPPGYDYKVYHIYGMLFTSNGTNEYVCYYLDNIFQSCQYLPPLGDGTNYAADRHFLKLALINTGNFVSNTINFYLKHYRVWSCSNWNVGLPSPPYTNATAAYQCTNSTLFQAGGAGPSGVGDNLEYYHP
jgi:hypothetical protein